MTTSSSVKRFQQNTYEFFRKNSLCRKSFATRWFTNITHHKKMKMAKLDFLRWISSGDGCLEICFVQTLPLREFILFHFSLSFWIVELSFIFFSITMLEAWQKKIGQILSIAIKAATWIYWRKLSLDKTWFMSPKNQMIENSHSVESYPFKIVQNEDFQNIKSYCAIYSIVCMYKNRRKRFELFTKK